ncbi:DMT family transporter [Nocardia goodfellowii]|uniref:Drug/metabolite transporter (DMT)-like permease n=1 Tax=Nocardia goodfellowii TaxID=882446 RepID=A0ABS4Q9G3_9NOCA|nr:EamA family transporter [Nocardia goodfellowii]MBP2188329.1 drug/metabolite transporter (DMT)-like permease [Nocardia goodfellowii]
MTRRGWVLFLAMGAIWGVPYAMIRIAVEDFDPFVVAFGRTLIGGLILLPIALFTKSLMPVLRRWKPLLAYTLVEITGPWFLIGYAETTLNSSTVGLLIAAVPLIAVVLVATMGHETFDTRRVLGLIVGFGGVATLVGLDVDLSDPAAIGAIGLTAIGYAIGPIIINRSLADLPPMGVVTASLMLAAIIYAPMAALRRPAHYPADASWSVVGLAVICTALAFLVFFALISEVGPSRATVITYINPAVAIMLGVTALNEPLTAGMAIGFPLVILGSILGTARSRASRPADDAQVAPCADVPVPPGSYNGRR